MSTFPRVGSCDTSCFLSDKWWIKIPVQVVHLGVISGHISRGVESWDRKGKAARTECAPMRGNAVGTCSFILPGNSGSQRRAGSWDSPSHLQRWGVFTDEEQPAIGGWSQRVERVSFSTFIPCQSGFPPPEKVLAKDTAAVTWKTANEHPNVTTQENLRGRPQCLPHTEFTIKMKVSFVGLRALIGGKKKKRMTLKILNVFYMDYKESDYLKAANLAETCSPAPLPLTWELFKVFLAPGKGLIILVKAHLYLLSTADP